MRPAVLGLLLILAGVASAQPKDLSRYERGEQLLTDPRFPAPKDRQVFAVKGHPELAISVLIGEDASLQALELRKANLEKLAAAGVPTLRVLEIGTIDGRPAYLHRRMATGTGRPNWLTDRGPILDEGTKRALDEARAKLEKSGIGVKEAELWFDSNGRVFIDAPKGVVTKAESGPWSSFYVRQTTGHMESVKGLADISISHRKNVVLRAMKEAKDAKLARFFEFGTVDLVESDVRGEAALRDALSHYLAKGEGTALSKQLGEQIAKGRLNLFFDYEHGVFLPKPNDVKVPIGRRSFPELAFDLVREGAFRALGEVGAVERSVLADLQAFEFWRAKKTPAKVASLDHPAARAERIDAETLIREAEARAGKTLSSSERAALLSRARGFSRPSDTAGVSGAVEERVRAERDRPRGR